MKWRGQICVQDPQKERIPKRNMCCNSGFLAESPLFLFFNILEEMFQK